jgi:aminotransferase
MSDKYLARHVVGLKPSGIRKFFDIVATMQDVISLGIGEPDFVTPAPIIEAGIRSLHAGETHYTSNAGLIALREAVAEHLHQLYGITYQAKDEVIISVGVSEALYLTMSALLNPGEEVVVPTPCFVSYQAEVILAGGVPVEIPTYVENGFQLRPEDLQAAITPRKPSCSVIRTTPPVQSIPVKYWRGLPLLLRNMTWW